MLLGRAALTLTVSMNSREEQSAHGAGDARVLEGHSFIVGAAVSIGGRDIKPGISVYRFANRIPLLFEVSSC
jgi:DNA topoisomerase-6 subunit B